MQMRNLKLCPSAVWLVLLVSVAGCEPKLLPHPHHANIDGGDLVYDGDGTSVDGSYVRDGVTLRFAVDASHLRLADASDNALLEYIASPDGSTRMEILGLASVVAWRDASDIDQEI